MPFDCRPRAIAITPFAGRVRVEISGVTVAESERALALEEPGHPVRYYLPADAVPPGLLDPSATRSTCPFKGEAIYFDLLVGDRRFKDAVWSYADPCAQVAPIAGHLAFWGDAVAITTQAA